MAEYGTTITVYDSPSGDKGDDWTEIKVEVVFTQSTISSTISGQS